MLTMQTNKCGDLVSGDQRIHEDSLFPPSCPEPVQRAVTLTIAHSFQRKWGAALVNNKGLVPLDHIIGYHHYFFGGGGGNAKWKQNSWGDTSPRDSWWLRGLKARLCSKPGFFKRGSWSQYFCILSYGLYVVTQLKHQRCLRAQVGGKLRMQMCGEIKGTPRSSAALTLFPNRRN